MVGLSRAVATELTGSEVPLAPKHVQHHMEPRKGSLIMLGADWSFVSTDAQGVQERVGQVTEGAGKSVEAAEMEGIYGKAGEESCRQTLSCEEDASASSGGEASCRRGSEGTT